MKTLGRQFIHSPRHRRQHSPPRDHHSFIPHAIAVSIHPHETTIHSFIHSLPTPSPSAFTPTSPTIHIIHSLPTPSPSAFTPTSPQFIHSFIHYLTPIAVSIHPHETTIHSFIHYPRHRRQHSPPRDHNSFIHSFPTPSPSAFTPTRPPFIHSPRHRRQHSPPRDHNSFIHSFIPHAIAVSIHPHETTIHSFITHAIAVSIHPHETTIHSLPTPPPSTSNPTRPQFIPFIHSYPRHRRQTFTPTRPQFIHSFHLSPRHRRQHPPPRDHNSFIHSPRHRRQHSLHETTIHSLPTPPPPLTNSLHTLFVTTNSKPFILAYPRCHND
ncbi:hypothetical protein HNY73_014067 [Argiope bruennichi]|uniref:Uncharacterized protein n=1 Tax=Argiope bruennichi TaxID=94029 RepID=A0A8T0EMW6_ARGBR|nr:hypothetical protein HNY73_014067 [Argiope bruennichi]